MAFCSPSAIEKSDRAPARRADLQRRRQPHRDRAFLRGHAFDAIQQNLSGAIPDVVSRLPMVVIEGVNRSSTVSSSKVTKPEQRLDGGLGSATHALERRQVKERGNEDCSVALVGRIACPKLVIRTCAG
jgi:hypothetical protein